MRLAPAFFVVGIGIVALAAGSSCGPTPNTGSDLTVTFSPIDETGEVPEEVRTESKHTFDVVAAALAGCSVRVVLFDSLPGIAAARADRDTGLAACRAFSGIDNFLTLTSTMFCAELLHALLP